MRKECVNFFNGINVDENSLMHRALRWLIFDFSFDNPYRNR